jgi:hypothetical protein
MAPADLSKPFKIQLITVRGQMPGTAVFQSAPMLPRGKKNFIKKNRQKLMWREKEPGGLPAGRRGVSAPCFSSKMLCISTSRPDYLIKTLNKSVSCWVILLNTNVMQDLYKYATGIMVGLHKINTDLK